MPTPDAVSVSTHFRGPLRLLPRCVSTCTVLSMAKTLIPAKDRRCDRSTVDIVQTVCSNTKELVDSSVDSLLVF